MQRHSEDSKQLFEKVLKTKQKKNEKNPQNNPQVKLKKKYTLKHCNNGVIKIQTLLSKVLSQKSKRFWNSQETHWHYEIPACPPPSPTYRAGLLHHKLPVEGWHDVFLKKIWDSSLLGLVDGQRLQRLTVIIKLGQNAFRITRYKRARRVAVVCRRWTLALHETPEIDVQNVTLGRWKIFFWQMKCWENITLGIIKNLWELRENRCWVNLQKLAKHDSDLEESSI